MASSWYNYTYTCICIWLHLPSPILATTTTHGNIVNIGTLHRVLPVYMQHQLLYQLGHAVGGGGWWRVAAA